MSIDQDRRWQGGKNGKERKKHLPWKLRLSGKAKPKSQGRKEKE
jgi:hypothetical protein